ncbi:MAG: hypothetical protein ACLTV1_11745 [Christensenellales bacterium]
MAAVKKTFDIALDIADAGANREFTVVDGDNGNVLAILPHRRGLPGRPYWVPGHSGVLKERRHRLSG